MSQAKQITKAFTNMVKDSDRVRDAVDQQKDKLLKESLNVLKKAGIDPAALPFDPIAVLNGNFPNPQSLLNSDIICSIPIIPPDKIEAANNVIDSVKETFSTVIENTNKLKSALVDIQTPLASIQTTGDTLLNLANTLSNVIMVIKAIPIPTAFGAPAVALPVKVLTILSSTLIKLDKKVSIAKGTISLIPPMINRISGILNEVIEKVSSLEQALQPALTMLSLVKSAIDLAPQCPDIPPEDIQAVVDETTGTLTEALLSSGDSSLLAVNVDNELELLNSFPFSYKGFLLELENNPDNTFPFPSRRIKGTRDFTADPDEGSGGFSLKGKGAPIGEIIIFNDPAWGSNRFSFSTSLSVLVKEINFKIDSYLKGVIPIALPSVTEGGDGKVRGETPPRGNQQQFTPPPDPIIEIDPRTGLTYGGDDPPSPTGSNTPPQPPAFYFSDPSQTGNAVGATPISPLSVGSFTVVRPIKIKMTTFGGTNQYSDSTGFLRIYKQGGSGQISYMMEQQFADNMEMTDTGNNPQGFNAPFDFYPINPIYANGTVINELGIFQYELELTDYNGEGQGLDNFTTFEIEAQ